MLTLYGNEFEKRKYCADAAVNTFCKRGINEEGIIKNQSNTLVLAPSCVFQDIAFFLIWPTTTTRESMVEELIGNACREGKCLNKDGEAWGFHPDAFETMELRVNKQVSPTRIEIGTSEHNMWISLEDLADWMWQGLPDFYGDIGLIVLDHVDTLDLTNLELQTMKDYFASLANKHGIECIVNDLSKKMFVQEEYSAS